MSYCRWSSDNFGCDLYVYEDTSGGWTVHVAGNRVVGKVPRIIWPAGRTPEAVDCFKATYDAQMEFLATAKREVITLPHAGETFNVPTAGECADLVERLAALGYRVPAYVARDLRQEAADA